MTQHICIDFWTNSTQVWIQGGAKIGDGAPSLMNFVFRTEGYSNKPNT